MRKAYKLFIALAVFTVVSCSEKEHSHSHDHQGHEAGTVMEEGERWEANQETKDAIKEMTSILEKNHNNISSENLAELGEELNKPFQEMLERCTMTGEAHEQLHHFLTPVQASLENIKTGTASEDEVHELLLHLKNFNTHFY